VNASSENQNLLLVVDGNNSQRLETCAHLLLEGFDVIEAADASTALNLVNARQPAVIVISYDLQDEEGTQLCTRLRALPAGAMTAVLLLMPDVPQVIDSAYDAGADDVLPLPANPHLLRRRAQLLHKLAEQRLISQRAQRQAHQFFHDNRAVMILIDPLSGKIADANRAACSFYGYTREQLSQKVLSDLDAPIIDNDKTLKTTNLVMRHQLANGDIRDIVVFSGPVEFEGRKHVCMIVHDVTKRKLAEVAEQNQRSFADALRATAATLVDTLDLREVIQRILNSIDTINTNRGAGIMVVEGNSARMLQVRGYADESRHQAIVGNIRFDIQKTFTLRTVMQTGKPCIIPDVHQQENWEIIEGLEWVRSHMTIPIRINNAIIGFLCVDNPNPNAYTHTDAEHLQAFADQAAIAINNAQMYQRVSDQAAILEQRVRERTSELEHERAHLSAILASITEGVVYAEFDGRRMNIRFVNQAISEMTGYSEVEWLQKGLSLFVDDEGNTPDKKEQYDEGLRQLTESGRWQTELTIPRRDGTRFLAAVSSARVHLGDGAPLAAVGVIRDISKEKALAEQKSRFVAHASHELRTPLTNMKTRLYLLKKQPQKLDEHLLILDEVTNRMKRLVEDLLDLSRFERGAFDLYIHETDLNALLHSVVDLQKQEALSKGLDLVCDIPVQPVYASVDRERLTQVITNLVTNAINYTPSGGRVTLRLCPEESAATGNAYALVEIEDTGIGIASTDVANIFQPFYRVPSNVQGTGLGLSIAREIVALHGGEISVQSQPGLGSIFRVKLPQSLPAAEVMEVLA
jgi:PAS domain S-box-containing protein